MNDEVELKDGYSINKCIAIILAGRIMMVTKNKITIRREYKLVHLNEMIRYISFRGTPRKS